MQKNAFQRLADHPRGFWFVFWGELAERASYYGMRTILAMYLFQVLRFQESTGAVVGQLFTASCYIAPLLGGYLADRWLGRYRTILYFSLPYIAGHLILGGIQQDWGMYFALSLLAMGSGTIKPNTSTLMGAMYEEQKKSALLTEAFSYFYAAINIGAAVSSLSLPVVRNHFAGPAHDWSRGYSVALAIPAALMGLAFLFFAIGKRFYPKDEQRPLSESLAERRRRPPKTAEQRRAEWRTLGRIAGIFSLIAIFWFVYDQQSSTWIYFANKHLDLTLWNAFALRVGSFTWTVNAFTVTPDQIQGLNPVLIVVLTPLFNWLWGFWKRRRGGVELPDTRKMLLGFAIVIACEATMGVAASLAGPGKVTVWWMAVATLVITMAELCISVVGLEFAYSEALPGTKSIVTAAFLFTVFIGDSLGAGLDRFYDNLLKPAPYFFIQTAVMIVAAVAFIFVARKFEREAAARSETALPPGGTGGGGVDSLAS